MFLANKLGISFYKVSSKSNSNKYIKVIYN